MVADPLEPGHALQCITGFRRARNFGLLHPNCKRLIALLHLLLKFVPASALAWIKPRPPIVCSCCGAVMTIVRTLGIALDCLAGRPINHCETLPLSVDAS